MSTQVVQNLPAQFVQDLGQDLAKQVVAQSGVPTVSVGLAGISQRPGEDPKDFAARQQAAREFETPRTTRRLTSASGTERRTRTHSCSSGAVAEQRFVRASAHGGS